MRLDRLDEALQGLARDRFFMSRAVGGKAALRRLPALLKPPPARLETLFAETLQGEGPAFRFAGLLLAAALGASPKTKRFKGRVRVPGARTKVFVGDVHLRGDLVLSAQSIFVATGDLIVDGNIIVDELDYSLVAAGGELRVRNLISAGEVLAGRRLKILGSAYLHGNDYSALAPRVEAGVLVENDRENTFGQVSAGRREKGFFSEEDGRRFAKVAEALGLAGASSVEELRSSFLSWLLGGKKPVFKAKASEAPKRRATLDVVTRDRFNRTPLQAALWNNEPIDALLRAGADVNARDGNGGTAFWLTRGEPSLTAKLLKYGGDPNIQNKWGWSALHHEAYYGDFDAAALLIKAGAELESRALPFKVAETAGGETPLWLACYRGWMPMVKTLLQAGANPRVKNDKGWTLLDAVDRSLATIDLSPLKAFLQDLLGVRP